MPRRSFGRRARRLKHPSNLSIFQSVEENRIYLVVPLQGTRTLRCSMEEQTNYMVERNIEKGEPGEAITSNDDRSPITRRDEERKVTCRSLQDRATRIQLRSGKIRTDV